MASKGYGHGGAREGAGGKPTWELGAATAVIRVPDEIKEAVIKYARELDRKRAREKEQLQDYYPKAV